MISVDMILPLRSAWLATVPVVSPYFGPPSVPISAQPEASAMTRSSGIAISGFMTEPLSKYTQEQTALRTRRVLIKINKLHASCRLPFLNGPGPGTGRHAGIFNPVSHPCIHSGLRLEKPDQVGTCRLGLIHGHIRPPDDVFLAAFMIEEKGQADACSTAIFDRGIGFSPVPDR